MRGAPRRAASDQGTPVAQPLPPHAQTGLPRAVTADNAQQAGLLALLEIETLVRGCREEAQLHLVMTHETQKIVRCRQCFLLLEGVSGRMQVASISGLAAVDRTVPLVRDVEQAIEITSRREDRGEAHTVQLIPGLSTLDSLSAYPFTSTLWMPLTGADKRRLGGLLLARETPWTEADARICDRLANPYAYALEALRRQPGFDRRKLLSLRTALAAAVLAACALALPVPMTALAPFEVAARDPAIVTTGADGVIETVEIEPNTLVQPGQLLVRLADISARNRLELAEREVLVAGAKIKKWQQMSFGDPRANHELAIASAELRLRAAERDWAREQLGLSEVRSARAGIAVFLDKKDLIGKPVAVGEKIMEIADPAHVEARLDVAVADALILQTGARAKLFLDSDPLHAREARIGQADYQARVRPNNTLALRAVAQLAGDDAPLPRLGTRGMAQVFGESVPLGYYFFRRPISALRQWFGL